MIALYHFEISLLALTGIFTLVYIFLLYSIKKGWDATKVWNIPKDHSPSTQVSIVIAARNEENHVENCLKSILQNDYPKSLFEVIVVDDNSFDNTAQIIEKYHPEVHLIRLLEGAGKKKALEAGIQEAKGTLIACTDADCTVPKQWISSFASYFEAHQSQCIAAPIAYHADDSHLQRFQYIDGLNNMCVTANGIKRESYFMANGANIIFTKSAFVAVGGYRQNIHLASGDDMFLIQAIAHRFPGGVHFLKSMEANVMTACEHTWVDLKHQRTRWATKSRAYNGSGIMLIQGTVFFFILLILANLILGMFGSTMALTAFVVSLCIKWMVDYIYLSGLADFFKNKRPLRSFIPVSIGFIAYILFAAWKALWPTSYQWKGRKTH